MSGKSNMNRRKFLKMSGMSTAAIALGSTGLFSLTGNSASAAPAKQTNSTLNSHGFGPLQPDPGGVLNLPQGFQYRIFSEEGGKLSDGRPVPAMHDGMVAIQGKNNSTILVRNHELSEESDYPVIGKNPYHKDNIGGTTALIVGPDRKLQTDYVASSGTYRNCAGGGTPWGTWITCEETLVRGHGYVFEVDPLDPENKLSRTPIREMGLFSHEAVDIDPSTGIVYLTEDDDPSFFYRFLPNDRSQRIGSLHNGGTLQAAAIEELSQNTANNFNEGKKYGIVWKDVNPENPSMEAEQKGCIQFSRLEGCHFVGGVFWFSDTDAGSENLGRIYRYIPATNTLELFFESTSANDLESPDNITVSPWGDLWIVEDGDGSDRIIGLTPQGETYVFAENVLNDSELAGPTFSPDGQTLFVNIQDPGITFAIWGRFPSKNNAAARVMGAAAPAKNYAPKISENLSAYAQVKGMTDLEAAAFQRNGVSFV